MSPGRDFRVVTLALLPLAFGSAIQAQEVYFHHPDAARVTVRSVTVGEPGIAVDFYYPPATRPEPYPVVVFVLAFPDPPPMKDWEPYTSWARLLAAEGFVGVLYEISNPAADLATVLDYVRHEAASLHVDPDRLALWSCSANAPLALARARTRSDVTLAALVAYYGLMPTPDGYQSAALDSARALSRFALPPYHEGERYPADLPMLIVRAGRDRWPVIRRSLDHFVAFALEQNLPVTVVNYSTGQHAFDILDDTEETRAVIKQTIDFLRTHLGS